jgi:hypothetical protein
VKFPPNINVLRTKQSEPLTNTAAILRHELGFLLTGDEYLHFRYVHAHVDSKFSVYVLTKPWYRHCPGRVEASHLKIYNMS